MPAHPITTTEPTQAMKWTYQPSSSKQQPNQGITKEKTPPLSTLTRQATIYK